MWCFRHSRNLPKWLDNATYKKTRFYSNIARRIPIKEKLDNGPSLKDFIEGSTDPMDVEPPDIPYLPSSVQNLSSRKVYFDVYGCQMNLNDTEIVWSILKKNGFEKTTVEEEADVFLVMTCAIREGAESKIWHRLDHLRGFKRRRKNMDNPVKIGILGCMAERLKEKLIEKEKSVDLVAGPDSYRDLPRLLALTDSGQRAVNVLLSLDETYADVVPVRLNQSSVTAFISIMRGCDNMCSYCIVPFTRGRERSRPVSSIVDEVRMLADAGVKDITLLGQNVNSYRDTTQKVDKPTSLAKGFRTVYKDKRGGVRFADLLAQVSAVDPEVRIRFTAAHPKDFPDEERAARRIAQVPTPSRLAQNPGSTCFIIMTTARGYENIARSLRGVAADVLQVISSRSNICKLLHLPAQSGSTTVLERMRRGYSREAYLELVARVKEEIPGVGLSTDMICGFCGETDAQFEETLSLMEAVDYHVAFLFIYSMREKTTAYRRYKDDIPPDVKKDRHNRIYELYRRKCQLLNEREIGNTHLILIEGTVPKTGQIYGRNEFYIKVVFNQKEMVDHDGGYRKMKPGDYVAVRILSAKSSVLNGEPICFTGVKEFYGEKCWADRVVKL